MKKNKINIQDEEALLRRLPLVDEYREKLFKECKEKFKKLSELNQNDYLEFVKELKSKNLERWQYEQECIHKMLRIEKANIIKINTLYHDLIYTFSSKGKRNISKVFKKIKKVFEKYPAFLKEYKECFENDDLERFDKYIKNFIDKELLKLT